MGNEPEFQRPPLAIESMRVAHDNTQRGSMPGASA
jgi:hypothetical protein